MKIIAKLIFFSLDKCVATLKYRLPLLFADLVFAVNCLLLKIVFMPYSWFLLHLTGFEPLNSLYCILSLFAVCAFAEYSWDVTPVNSKGRM